jgi:hypothetical protein
MYVGERATESFSAMARLSSRMGIRMTGASTSSAFIMVNKIRRTLRNASNKEADEKIRIQYDRLTSKLERLSPIELEYIVYIMQTSSFPELITLLKTKATMIRKFASKWNKARVTPDEDLKESDDPTDNVMKYSQDITPEDS